MDKNQNKSPNSSNPNNDAYWQARGFEKRPANWQRRLKAHSKSKRAIRKEYYIPMDGGYTWPLCSDDY